MSDQTPSVEGQEKQPVQETVDKTAVKPAKQEKPDQRHGRHGRFDRGRRGGRGDRGDRPEKEFADKTISIKRVAKVVKGGKRFSFSALVAVGDGKGKVGVGLGKAREIPDAVRKAIDHARKNMLIVPLIGTTVPHEVSTRFGASKIILKPASPGTGVIAGGAVRVILELAGVKDILTKSLKSSNPHNLAKATMCALMSLKTIEKVAEIREKKM